MIAYAKFKLEFSMNKPHIMKLFDDFVNKRLFLLTIIRKIKFDRLRRTRLNCKSINRESRVLIVTYKRKFSVC